MCFGGGIVSCGEEGVSVPMIDGVVDKREWVMMGENTRHIYTNVRHEMRLL